MDVKVNGYNLVIIQGRIKSVERTNNHGRALTRLLVASSNYIASVYCYSLLAGSKAIIEGAYITVIGKLRYSTDSKGYKIIATEVLKAPDDSQFNIVLIEGYFVNNMFRHFSINKEGDIYQLPLFVNFGDNKKEKTTDLIKDNLPFILEGRMFYNKEHKLEIRGQHIRCSYPVNMEV